MTTMNAWYLTEKDLRMELWLWRAYMRCGSDIFCPTIFSEDLEWELVLTDGIYLKVPADRSDKTKKQKKLGEHEFGGNLGEIANVYAEGFFLEDLFIGLWDRITNKWYEEPERFKEIIQDMKNHWSEYISPPKGNEDYKKIWEGMRRLLIESLEEDRKTILRCSLVLDAVEDEWDQFKKDEYMERRKAEEHMRSAGRILHLMSCAERDQVNFNTMSKKDLDLLGY
jgi:hypothetical protein